MACPLRNIIKAIDQRDLMMEELELPQLSKKNESHLDERGWERQTTKPIAYNFGVLFNDGKKIVCLQNR